MFVFLNTLEVLKGGPTLTTTTMTLRHQLIKDAVACKQTFILTYKNGTGSFRGLYLQFTAV